MVISREMSPQGVLTVKFSIIQGGEKLKFSPSSPISLGEQGMMRDRYEDSMVYLAMSDIPGAGEGLFAKKDVPRNTIVAFFNGLKIPTDVDFVKELFAFDEVGLTYDSCFDHIKLEHIQVSAAVHEGVHHQARGGLPLLPGPAPQSWARHQAVQSNPWT